MKKLIAILVVFALAMGAAFAETSVSGAVFGDVTLFGSDTDKGGKDGDIKGSGGFGRGRIEASGGDDDGVFGAWVRLDTGVFSGGQAWWKPIDQFKMIIGKHPDGPYNKEGNTAWAFYGTPTDTNVTFGGSNVWGGALGNPLTTRVAFYDGFGAFGLILEIKPIEMLGINIMLPYNDEAEVADIFGGINIQFDLNLDFGNIALSYKGPGARPQKEISPGTGLGDAYLDNDPDSSTYGTVQREDKPVYDGYNDTPTNGQIFVYAGIPIGDNVALDVGLGFTLPGKLEGHPIGIGAGVKVGITEQFGLKARIAASLLGDEKKAAGNSGNTDLLLDVLPYFAINDLMTVFVSVGFATTIPHKDNPADKLSYGFHFNPYVTVGSEWGPKFLAGFKLNTKFAYDGKVGGDDAPVYWSVPIAIQVGF